MLKLTLRLLLILAVFYVHGQGSSDEMVNVSGKIYSAKDTSVVNANILYEKLPYYDDMGMAVSTTEGFNLSLVNGYTYNVSIKKDGFLDFTGEVVVSGDGSLAQSEDFYLEVDEIELIKLENLIFARSSPRISESSYGELDELAIWMNENPTVTIQLEGHTDFRGNAQANMALSQARVEAVKEYLVDQRVKKSRIFTKAFGGTQPLSREDTEEAKTLNRRVEVRVISR